MKSPTYNLQYKIVYRTNYVGERLFQMGLTHSNTCTHCKDNSAHNYMHVIWVCTPYLSTWSSHCIPTSPKLCIIGDICEIDTALCIAKKPMLMNWKSKNIFMYCSIKKFTSRSNHLERTSASSQN